MRLKKLSGSSMTKMSFYKPSHMNIFLRVDLFTVINEFTYKKSNRELNYYESVNEHIFLIGKRMPKIASSNFTPVFVLKIFFYLRNLIKIVFFTFT